MRSNVATTVELLGLFGIPAVPHGNVIEISTGVVGIDEACSGIRSLQATLMISLFLGELYRLTVLRRVWLVVLGFVLAFAFNVGRTLLLTGIASAKGIGAIASWHDPAGVAILVACFLCLWLIARALQKAEMGTAARRDHETTGLEVQGAEVTVPSTFNSQLSTLRKLAFALTAWLLLVETGTELWYRYHERNPATAQQWSMNTEERGQEFTKIPIPSAIAGQFCADESTHARWQDAVGNSWQLYYFRWLPAHSLRQRVVIQLAKTHGPEKCLPAVGMSIRSSLGIISVPVAGMELAMQQYVFNSEGRPLHVFYGIYEDPSGSSKQANRRTDCASRVAAALAGSRNYGQRYLELAVFGYERPEDARAAVARELETLIKIEK
jgi:exosortase/archaeosortase family protein